MHDVRQWSKAIWIKPNTSVGVSANIPAWLYSFQIVHSQVERESFGRPWCTDNDQGQSQDTADNCGKDILFQRTGLGDTGWYGQVMHVLVHLHRVQRVRNETHNINTPLQLIRQSLLLIQCEALHTHASRLAQNSAGKGRKINQELNRTHVSLQKFSEIRSCFLPENTATTEEVFQRRHTNLSVEDIQEWFTAAFRLNVSQVHTEQMAVPRIQTQVIHHAQCKQNSFTTG